MKKKQGKYPLSSCRLLPDTEGSSFKKVRKEDMVFEEGMILADFLNSCPSFFSVFICTLCSH